MRSDDEEASRPVLKDACEQVHLNTRLETSASNGPVENSVRTMREVVQRQKDAVVSLGIECSITRPLFRVVGATQ